MRDFRQKSHRIPSIQAAVREQSQQEQQKEPIKEITLVTNNEVNSSSHREDDTNIINTKSGPQNLMRG